VNARPSLLFISPRYLLPADSGGKIRTGQILRGLKGGHFEITLASPAPAHGAGNDAAPLAALCDRFTSWPETPRGRLFPYLRMRYLLSRRPISVATDVSASARRLIISELERRPDVVVVDFTHAGVLMPERLAIPSVLFTHNVEAEIFARHLDVAKNPIYRAIWRNQLEKMRRFEQEQLRAFDKVIAVSERDGLKFRDEYGVTAKVIATGVDLDFLHFEAPAAVNSLDANIVFTASMDSFANIDGVQWFMDSIWPIVASAMPRARVTIIGRNPDARLVRLAKERRLAWTFTGSVEDVRPYVHAGTVYIIPLRVGGGTRIKAYEAIALGRPVVSTTIGVEGLKLEASRHYLAADTPEAFAAAVMQLLQDAPLRVQLAQEARNFVEQHFSAQAVAKTFEAICRGAAENRRHQSSNPAASMAVG
jgi:glycosyltransferase involved in cell wall biosynthesis